MSRNEVHLNGTSREFLERFYKLEERMNNQRNDTLEIKNDIKLVKEYLIPLTKKVYFHEKIFKIIGASISLLLTTAVVVLAAIL